MSLISTSIGAGVRHHGTKKDHKRRRKRASETRNELETPNAGAVDADWVHCAGPRRRDLHLAHRSSQVEIKAVGVVFRQHLVPAYPMNSGHDGCLLRTWKTR